MDLESLKTRLNEVDASIRQMQDSYPIMIGHKNELTYWINELSKPVDVPAVDVDSAVSEHAPVPA